MHIGPDELAALAQLLVAVAALVAACRKMPPDERDD